MGGAGGDDNVTDFVVAGAWQQPSRRYGLSETSAVSDATKLDVTAGSNVHPPIPEFGGELRNCGPLVCSDVPAGKPQATDLTVVGAVQRDGAGATVTTTAIGSVRACLQTL